MQIVQRHLFRKGNGFAVGFDVARVALLFVEDEVADEAIVLILHEWPWR